MERWHLPSVDATGATEPRVLFSRSEARAVVLDLTAGQELGEHSVRETAILQVVTGTVELETGERSVSCEAGTLVLFEPGERHAVSALTDSRLLLLLAPWPAEGHYLDDENARSDRIPEAIRAPAIDDV